MKEIVINLLTMTCLVFMVKACTHREFYGKNQVSDPVIRSAEEEQCEKKGYFWHWTKDGQCHPKRFLEYCQDKKAPAGIVRTVNFIRNEIGQADCEKASKELNSLPGLYLGGYHLTDLEPLFGLLNLKFLRLEKNKIQSVETLSSLKNLMVLRLDENLLSDVGPLSSLTLLVVLRLDSNRIRDISPLSGLEKLARINLNQNQISDLKPLAQLYSLRKLGVKQNLIQNASPLSGLSKLSYLDLRDNPIDTEKHKKNEGNCPTTPPAPDPLIRFCSMKGRTTPAVRSGSILKGRGE